jgi:hypothetical protein
VTPVWMSHAQSRLVTGALSRPKDRGKRLRRRLLAPTGRVNGAHDPDRVTVGVRDNGMARAPESVVWLLLTRVALVLRCGRPALFRTGIEEWSQCRYIIQTSTSFGVRL